MQRRHFVEMLGGIGMLTPAAAPGAPGAKRTKFYVLQNYYLKAGDQLTRIHDYLRQGYLPALGKVHDGPKIVLEAIVSSHQPQVAVILGYQSLEEMAAAAAKVDADPDARKALEAWESGPEAPYEHFSCALLAATEYSPEIAMPATPPAAPRIFEVRVYHSPTWRQLRALHERFAGPEIRIFHRCGVHPILYTSTMAGANMPNLTYVIPFENLAAREKAWNAFAADPEWVKVRKESIDRSGQISSVIQISLFRAAPYSPVR